MTTTTVELKKDFDRKLEIVTAGLPQEYSKRGHYSSNRLHVITKSRSQSFRKLQKRYHKVLDQILYAS